MPNKRSSGQRREHEQQKVNYTSAKAAAIAVQAITVDGTTLIVRVAIGCKCIMTETVDFGTLVTGRKDIIE